MTQEINRFEENDLFLAIQARYDRWFFAEHSDDSNFAFSHQLANTTLELFPYLGFVGSGLFSGEEAPSSLKPLVSRIHGSDTLYDNDLKVALELRGEDEHIKAYLPGFDDLMKGGKTFDEIVGTYAVHPEVLEGMRPAQDIEDEAVVVKFSDEGGTRGLEFISLPDRVELSVFGYSKRTRAFSRYLTTYHDKPKVLAETAASLAVLAARHCLRSNNPSSPDYLVELSEQNRKFLGDLL